MRDKRLSPTEFGCVLYDVANTVNERPVGVLSSSDSELSVLTPNSLLLGRSRAKNPGGWEPIAGSKLTRFHLVHQITDCFWKQWIKLVAPGLVTDEKWHAKTEDLKKGDVVLVLDSDSFKAQYRLAMVQEVYPGADGVVRKVKVMYKHYRVGSDKVQYRGLIEESIFRPVQRLSLVTRASDN